MFPHRPNRRLPAGVVVRVPPRPRRRRRDGPTASPFWVPCRASRSADGAPAWSPCRAGSSRRSRSSPGLGGLRRPADRSVRTAHRCKASGVSRQFSTPYGTEFVEVPELQRMYIMDNGGPNSYRIIYLDARAFPENITPTNYGYSIGRWEGDTLVVETRGLNEKFWMDQRRHAPHGAAESHRAPHAARLQHTPLSGDYRRPGCVHPAVDDQRLHASVEARRRAVRVHLPAVQPGPRADAREPGRRGQHALLRALNMLRAALSSIVVLALGIAPAAQEGHPLAGTWYGDLRHGPSEDRPDDRHEMGRARGLRHHQSRPRCGAPGGRSDDITPGKPAPEGQDSTTGIPPKFHVRFEADLPDRRRRQEPRRLPGRHPESRGRQPPDRRNLATRRREGHLPAPPLIEEAKPWTEPGALGGRISLPAPGTRRGRPRAHGALYAPERC